VQLFSSKGYANVGIRELCRASGIKEASFYNHYGSKEALLDAVFERWREVNERTIEGADELVEIALKRGPRAMIQAMMARFASVTASPLVYGMLAIIRMESFVNAKARALALKSMYYYRRDPTLKALKAMRDAGMLAASDLEDWTAAYYYGLIGILDEYVLKEIEGDGLEEIRARIERHMGFFGAMLEPARG
jgi:AcrR family transcriptional regulator